jgi:hypothetical protein
MKRASRICRHPRSGATTERAEVRRKARSGEGAAGRSNASSPAHQHALREALAELENAGYLAGVHTTRREVLLALGLDPVDEANEDHVKQARAKVNDLLGLDDEGDDD